jgi:hypothetical protein
MADKLAPVRNQIGERLAEFSSRATRLSPSTFTPEWMRSARSPPTTAWMRSKG